MVSILVVDDDSQYCDLLNDFLESNNYHVTIANSASQAVDIYSKQNIDIIISDVLMPEKDGIELLLALKRSNFGSLPHVIMISGGGLNPATPYLEMANALGATKVFAKPVPLNELKNTIETMIGEDNA